MHACTPYDTCLITCEWQSFLGVTMLVIERLHAAGFWTVTLFDTVAEPVSECSANSYSYFNIIISMLNLSPSALQILSYLIISMLETVTDHLL